MPGHTVGSLIESVHEQFAAAPLSYGHGTDNAWDEAVMLVLQVSGAEDQREALQQPVADAAVQDIFDLARRRVTERCPLAYLLGQCRYMGYDFHIRPGVVVPRSPIGYLLGQGLGPWLPAQVRSILDLCSGSGCLGIVAAHRFAGADVTLVELDPLAVDVARRNISRHGLDTRVRVLQADVTGDWPWHAGLAGQVFDLVLCNPPYVDAADMAVLPPEYRAEPRHGLGAGADGLEVLRSLLQQAPGYLQRAGLFVGEAGNSTPALLQAFPRLPFIWPELEAGGEGVFVLEGGALSSHTAGSS